MRRSADVFANHKSGTSVNKSVEVHKTNSYYEMYYAKQIKVGTDRELRFSFGRIFPDDRDLYFVRVTDENKTEHNFHMERQQGSWKITPESEVADWIKNIEADLHNAIITGPLRD